MTVVRTWLRGLTSVSKTFRKGVDGERAPRLQRVVTTVAIVAVLVGAAGTWRHSVSALTGFADMVAQLSSAQFYSAQDDGAGGLSEASTAATEAERYLPIPSALEDERVLAAMGPIAVLSCKKSDYAAPTQDASQASDLGPPLEDKSATAWIDRSATAAAMSPIAALPDTDDAAGDAGGRRESDGSGSSSLSAPLSSPKFEVDDLLTRNLLAAGLSPIAALPAPESANCPALLRHTFNKLQTGEPQTLCQFQGKVLLIVNTASYCAYTNQYEALEAMYRKYRDRGLVIVGFPSNDFGKQEPGSNQEIAEFCRTTYGVQFPMFEKTSVSKLNANPLYVELAAQTGATPKWNFHKYVVDRNGTPVATFASNVTPESPKLVELIERLLAEKYAAKN